MKTGIPRNASISIKLLFFNIKLGVKKNIKPNIITMLSMCFPNANIYYYIIYKLPNIEI